VNYLEIKYLTGEKLHDIPDAKMEFKTGNHILIENNKITEIAEIVAVHKNKKIDKEKADQMVTIIRVLNDEDKKKVAELKKKSRDYIPICLEKIKKHEMISMKLLDAELSFDEKKITFYFSAEGRVDFRELVSDLVKSCKKIIRLQQIGSRDEAKIMGGVGKCGREICCSTFLKDIESVTLDAAKEQDIVFGSSKLSGLCGKLMCCLAYELEEYKKIAAKMPKIGDIVKYKKDKGRVIGRNIIKETYRIQTEDGKVIEAEI